MVPRLPIPNRTVKRLSADDSMDTHVKVGHCQAPIQKPPKRKFRGFRFAVLDECGSDGHRCGKLVIKMTVTDKIT